LAVMPPAVALSQVCVTFRLPPPARRPAAGGGAAAGAGAGGGGGGGAAGRGKSTWLNLAAARIAPSSGRIDVFGAPLSRLNRQAGYLFQAEALFPWKTALDNVAIGLETAGVARPLARARAQAWLTRVGLSDFAA